MNIKAEVPTPQSPESTLSPMPHSKRLPNPIAHNSDLKMSRNRLSSL